MHIYPIRVGIASCADNLDSDKYFKDRMLLEDVFTDETRTERWLAHAFSYLSGENMDVSVKIIICSALPMIFISVTVMIIKHLRTVHIMKASDILGSKL